MLQGAQSDLLSIYSSRGERVYLLANQALHQLSVFPESGPVNWMQIRRLVVPRTNLGIFYTLAGRRVMVGALLDLRQDERWIKKRLREL